MAIIDMQDAEVSISDGAATPSPVIIGGLTSIELDGGDTPDNDVTTLKSTAQEFRPGLQDFGQATFNLFRDLSDVGQQECVSAKAAAEVREFVVTYADTSTQTFDAYVKSISSGGSVGEQSQGTLTIKITGEVTETPAT